MVITLAEVWRALDEITDPEIPVVSLVEMGIVRDAQIEGDTVIVTMTPTFAGCPALRVMRDSIVEKLTARGAAHVEVKTVLTPRWSSDWLTDAAREKLKAFGLAPRRNMAATRNCFSRTKLPVRTAIPPIRASPIILGPRCAAPFIFVARASSRLNNSKLCKESANSQALPSGKRFRMEANAASARGLRFRVFD